LIGTNTVLTEHNNAEVNVLDVMYFLIGTEQHATYNNASVLCTFSPSNNQLCERWANDANEYMVTGRSEKMTHQVVIYRSVTAMEYYNIVSIELYLFSRMVGRVSHSECGMTPSILFRNKLQIKPSFIYINQ